ncbi:helix-turn-helix domain-containing protein [Carboxylicivirga sp. RSCT41]|uniref:helix-turn-helix domain-containing protein n=1 Tax=Carboxylicivirga agarovorans TaxID=3417570 RepID=UPI003D3494DB
MKSAANKSINADRIENKLRMAIKQQGYTLKEIAALMGTTQPILSRKLSYGDWKLTFLEELSEILKVDLQTLLFTENNPSSPAIKFPFPYTLMITMTKNEGDVYCKNDILYLKEARGLVLNKPYVMRLENDKDKLIFCTIEEFLIGETEEEYLFKTLEGKSFKIGESKVNAFYRVTGITKPIK